MTDMSTAEQNKSIVRYCIEQFAAGNLDALRPLIRADFVEHSPGNPSGGDAWVDFLATAPVARARLEMRRLVAEDDHVVVHYRMVPPDDERGVAVVDIWRLADGQIAEHWDVVQPVPAPAEVPNGMF
jgi:predicted SnoaL-like aldol condensation-catalyzing enzyme